MDTEQCCARLATFACRSESSLATKHYGISGAVTASSETGNSAFLSEILYKVPSVHARTLSENVFNIFSQNPITPAHLPLSGVYSECISNNPLLNTLTPEYFEQYNLTQLNNIEFLFVT